MTQLTTLPDRSAIREQRKLEVKKFQLQPNVSHWFRSIQAESL